MRKRFLDFYKKYLLLPPVCITFSFFVFSTAIMAQDGALDNSFGNGGKVFTHVGPKNCEAHDLVIQGDGKIVVVGTANNGNNDDFAIVRYNSDGTLDSTGFGTNGIVITNAGPTNDYAYAVDLQQDGKIIVAGYAINSTDYDFAVIRLNPDGSIDNSFGTNGKILTPVGPEQDYAYDVAVQGDGKIIVAGYMHDGLNSDFALVRYNTDGSLDTGFDNDGIVTTGFNNNETISADVISRIAIQNDGKIIAAGYITKNSQHQFGLARYNSDGSLDNTFGANGLVSTDVISGAGDDAWGLTLMPNGKILVGGNTVENTAYVFAITKYNSDGSLDNSFDSDGILTSKIGTSDYIQDLLPLSNGQFIACGYSTQSNENVFAATRYLSDGSIDNSFGTNGTTTVQVASRYSYGYAAKLQQDGKFIMAGKSKDGQYNVFALARFNNSVATTGIKSTTNVPANFKLSQNYPNPFNPSTIIRFSIPKSSFVSLKIYDVTGKEVANLVNSVLNAGTYNYNFNSTALASGIYFYRIEADNFSETKKMILLR